jgi:hypothetical protein
MTESSRSRSREPITYCLIAPGCVTGPCESVESVALQKALSMPPGTEVVPLYRLTPSESGTVSVPRSLAERTEAMFRSVDPEGCIAQEWKDVIQR